MSYSNGTISNGAASLSELQEQLKAARIKRALLRTQAETSVLESYVGLSQYSAQWGQPIDPLDAVRDPLTGMLWRPVGSEKRHEPNANGLNNAREIGRLLLESNALAIGLMEHLVSFVVGEGMTYKVAADKGQKPPADLLLSVQDIVDEFVETNVWNEFEQELVRRSRRDGEYLLREFPVDGVLHVRTIEPEYVCPPDGVEAEQYPLGVKTAEGDDQTPVAFWVRCGSDDPGESIPADQVHHCKVNVDRAVLRGVSDFFPVADDLEGTRKLLRNMREGGAVQAAIAWIEQFDGATASSLTSQINAKRDLNRPYPNDPITGRQVNMQKLEPGTVVKVGGNRRYEPAPLAANTTQHIAIVQACLRAALTRWGMPEYLSGDASNANYASTLVAGAPFVRIVKRLQAFYKRRFLAVVKRAVQVAVEAGRLPGYTWGQVNRLVDIQAEPPDPVIADAAQQAQVRNIEHQAGVLSLRTWRAKAGYDDETETQNLQAEAAQQQAQQPQQPEPGGDTGNQGGGLASLFGESADPLAQRLAQLREQYGGGLAGEIAEAASRLLECGGEGGKPGPCPDGNATPQASPLAHVDEKAKQILAARKGLSEQARAVASAAGKKLAAKFKGMEQRYGRKAAIVIFGAAVALTPVPLPGTSLAPIAIAEGVLAVRRMLQRRKAGMALAAEARLPDDLAAAVRELIAAAYQDAGEEAPEIPDADLAEVLATLTGGEG